MAVLRHISERTSVRAYRPQPVEPDKLNAVLEAARLAPSARNMQDWRFVVVQDPDTRRRLCAAANNQRFVAEAPVVIAGCSAAPEYVMRCGHPACLINVAIALEHMALQAVEEGLGTCWIGSFYEDQVKAVLSIPDGVRVVELLTLGYPADAPRPRSRLPRDRIACAERWTLD